jgi:hypothetical protein
MKQKIGLENLHELNNGAARLVFKKQFMAALRDCEDLPMVREKREIPMKLILIPRTDPMDQKTFVGADIGLEIGQAKLPMRKLAMESLRVEIQKDADGVITGLGLLLETDPYQDRLLDEG